MMVTTSRGRALDLAFGALAAVQLGGAALLVPRGDTLALPGGTPLGGTCLSQSLFHVDCPFCGMTRSFVALAHGHLRTAFEFHPAGPLMFVTMVGLLVAVAAVTIRGGLPLSERPRFLGGLETIALVCVAIGIIKLVRS